MDACRVVVKQLITVIPDLYLQPTQQIRPFDVGDSDDKPIHLYERGGRLLIIEKDLLAVGVSGHKRLRDFDSTDATPTRGTDGAALGIASLSYRPL